MKKISEGNKGIQALAKKNPSLVEDKFGYDVPGFMNGGMPLYYQDGGLAGYMGGGEVNLNRIQPGNPEALDDVTEDFNNFERSIEQNNIMGFADGGIASYQSGGLLQKLKDGKAEEKAFSSSVFDNEEDLFEDQDMFGLNKSVAPEYDAESGKYVLNDKEYDSISDAIADTDNVNSAIKKDRMGEMASRLGNIQDLMPATPQMTQGRLVQGTGASRVQGFAMGGMAGEVGENYEEEYIYGDDFDEFGPGGFDINEYIKNVLGGGGGYTPPTEEDLAEARAGRISQGYGGGGGSGIGGLGSYSDTRPGASISVDAKDETPESYKFYPSEVSKLYSQMKGVPFSPLVAPPKEATYIDSMKPRRIKSQLYAADGAFVDRDMLITGPGGERGDKIPAMLSDGEFVVNAEAVRGMGVRAGADPQDEYEQRLEGARQMYALQKEGEQMMRKYS
tara:strand:- start:776 stop:2116 length:1341 start_codon:yes stop_codon:yes gene_type:complete